ncbi:hypothetical protein BT96DRAFT_915779 [Gymnopus androsaceus JB14]|uniref:Uncharacterized protein n=1 Tax=Gymnopus androsaceus JB14 TaxID=1447944 RepID=A0A6A4I5F9_9AGAR|nr:hypothetical protein BT96DRAFT_915779 [Gymnopus androsaceus JB14]
MGCCKNLSFIAFTADVGASVTVAAPLDTSISRDHKTSSDPTLRSSFLYSGTTTANSSGLLGTIVHCMDAYPEEASINILGLFVDDYHTNHCPIIDHDFQREKAEVGAQHGGMQVQI